MKYNLGILMHIFNLQVSLWAGVLPFKTLLTNIHFFPFLLYE